MKLTSLGIALAASVAGIAVAQAGEAVTFGTNWVAQPEHGGFYQSVADGTYEACGLDVTIVPGGPSVNNPALLFAGKIDFLMSGNLLHPFNSVREDIPMVAIAGMFQKEPQIIMTHPGVGLDTWEDLKNAESLIISGGGFTSFFRWMVAEGFREEQRKPYTFNSAPFLADKASGQQGYVTSEPLAIINEGGFEPNIFLLADYGFDTYSTLISTMQATIDAKPEVVQCFVDGSIIGWNNYMYGDRSAADALIRADNAEMGDAQMEFAIAQLNKFGIVDSGDSLTAGIGAMTDDRIKSFYDKMVAAGVIDGGLDYKAAYTLDFINKGVGVELKASLTGG